MAPPIGSSILRRFVSSMKDIFVSDSIVGKSWEGLQASEAFEKGELKSSGGGQSIRIAFRNLSPFPLLLCWISEDCHLYHFRKLPSRQHLTPQSPVSIYDHIENSASGHAFCLISLPEEELEAARQTKSLNDNASIIGGFVGLPPKRGLRDSVYLVTLSQKRKEDTEEVLCCGIFAFSKHEPVDSQENFVLQQQLAKLDPTPYDTSTKLYERKLLGGWPVYVEPNWHNGALQVEKRLGEDLKCAAEILPAHAVEYLRVNCPIWVNSSIKFGPRVCPIRGFGACYHPDKEWLIENGLCPDKAKCIEINDGPGYAKDVDLWGKGGLMVHELSHAYHNRMLRDGYKNKEIEECYNSAMKEGLYESVKVHGPQGPLAKAYACSNCMEYFAELSTAFLGGVDKNEEFNKWYPFNRQQIKEHDPRAYKLLSRVWKVEEKAE